jgi:hypothetical protein
MMRLKMPYGAELPQSVYRALTHVYKLFAPTPWTDVTFENGWSNHGTPYGDIQYRRAGDMVQIRGGGDGSLGVTAFTLPYGFRPPYTLEMGGVSQSSHALVYIYDDGQVEPQGSGSSSEFHFNYIFATDDDFPFVTR